MNFYQVTTGGQQYAFHARSIQAASQFVRHQPAVIVTRINYATFLTMLRSKLIRRALSGHPLALDE